MYGLQPFVIGARISAEQKNIISEGHQAPPTVKLGQAA